MMRTKQLARSAVTIINRLSQVAGIIAIIFLLSIMVLTVLDVILRYFLNAPIPGSVELTQYFMVVAGFLGLAWCAVKRGHVKVDLIINRLSPRPRAIIDSITLILALTVVPLVAWQSFSQARYVHLEKTASDLLEIPNYPFYIVMGLGFALLLLVLVTLLAEFIARAIKR